MEGGRCPSLRPTGTCNRITCRAGVGADGVWDRAVRRMGLQARTEREKAGAEGSEHGEIMGPAEDTESARAHFLSLL